MDRESDRDSGEARAREEMSGWREVSYVLAHCVVPQAAVLTCVALFLGPTFGVVATFGIPMLGGFVVAATSLRSDFAGCGGTVLVTFGLAALSSLVLGAAGPFCLMTAVVVFLPFIGIGAYGGAALRRHLESRRLIRRFLALLPLALLPLHWTEAALRGEDPHVVQRTEQSFDAPPSEVWRALRTYDEVDHQPPPLALRIGFPRPVSTQGEFAEVGDEQRCSYTKGFIVKRLTALEPGRRFSFDVLEQAVGFERSVRLRQGSFTLEPGRDGGTRLIVETVYEDRLRPAWIWRPFESWAVSSLHRYLIEGVERSRRELPAPMRFAELDGGQRSEPRTDR